MVQPLFVKTGKKKHLQRLFTAALPNRKKLEITQLPITRGPVESTFVDPFNEVLYLKLRKQYEGLPLAKKWII